MSDRGALPVPPAVPRSQAAWAFSWYITRLARRTFHEVLWRSATDWRAWSPLPTLVVANHTNWWDGFLSHQVGRAMGRHFRILMERRNLERYRAFLQIGALPMERRSRTQAMRDLAVATACLAPESFVWIYPQGQRRPAAEPLEHLEHGAAWMLARHAGPIRVVPVAFRYPFTTEQLPMAAILVGTPWEYAAGEAATRGRPALTATIAERLTKTVAALDADIAVERFAGYDTLIAGKSSINVRMDRVRHRLGLIDEYDERNG